MDTPAAAADHGAFGGVDAELLEPVERAAGSGDIEATTALLAEGASLNLQANSRPLARTVVHWAAWGGNPRVVRQVFIAMARTIHDPVARNEAAEARCLSHDGGRGGTTPLHLAATRGHADVAAMLLQEGASPNVVDGYERTALNLAVDAEDEAMVVVLVAGGANVNAVNNGSWLTPLHQAVERNKLAMCEVLLREGAQVNAMDEGGQTPVHVATWKGYGHIITALAGAGGDVRAQDRGMQEPMNFAYNSDNPESSIRALMAEGVDPLVGTPDGFDTAQHAALEDEVEGLSVMLDVGVDPNRRMTLDEAEYSGPSGCMGATLLYLAALVASERVTRLLLAAGAREDLPAFTRPRSDPRDPPRPLIRTIPADVVGKWDEHMPKLPRAELDRRVVAVRAMLSNAHFCRKGWLSVLRSRSDNGESLTGGGLCVPGVETWQGGREAAPAAAAAAAVGVGAGESGSAQSDRGGVGAFDSEDGAWCKAAAWLASVPGPDLFTLITDYL